MLTVPAIDEGSMVTMESDSLLPPTATARMNDAVHGDDGSISEASLTNDAEWRMVDLIHNNDNEHDDNHHAESGVLILDGEETEINLGTTATVMENNSGGGNIGNACGAGILDLSLGSGSVPSVVGSIDGLNAAAPSGNVPGNSTDNARISASTQTAPDLNDPNLITNSTGSTNEKPEEETTAIPHAYNNKSRLALFLVPTVALFLAPTIASIHLYRERNSLLRERDSVLRERNFLLDSVASLGEEVQSLKDEVKKKQREEALRWDACQAESMKQETVLLDNCWLSARANVQLRDCAIDAKERAMEKAIALSSTLLGGWEQLGNANTRSFGRVDPSSYNASNTMDDVGESVAKMMRKVDLLGWKLWDATSTKGHAQANERKDTNGSNTNGNSSFETPSFFSRMETNGKAQWKHTMNDMKSAFYTFFSPAEVKAASKSYQTTRATKRTRPDTLNDVVDGITDIVAAAGSLSASAGDAVVAAAVEKATGLLEFNGSYLDELLEIATQAAKDASLTHHAAHK